MTDIPDTYDPATVERRWREEWSESDVYRYEDTGAPDYVVDTPPPYPTGNLHIGNALGWCYMDFAARYHRMVGDDVCFPQGWDCHGLPTEVKVEENHGIHRTDVSREEFRELCVEHTERMIAEMKATMHTLGFSQDWSREYRTMDPAYWGKTQRSFVEMEADDYVYRDEHPVNWCPRCETAIADAEVETIDREGTLHYVTFPGVGDEAADGESVDEATDGEEVEIATTRPELLAACVAVAVHPDDDRYADRVGDTVTVPLFGHEVEILADAAVDADFGSGAVMVCTFGDKQDVDWWAEHDLPLRPVFTEDGRLIDESDVDDADDTSDADADEASDADADEASDADAAALVDALGDYAGLPIDEAHDRIAADLEAEGYLTDTETVDQSVGACWRCDTPIEILSTEQWFVEVRQDEILEHARAVEWVPEHMYTRLAEWTEGMDWDWVISRQRVFATPIPAWFCDDCGHVHVASVDEVPVDPTDDEPATGDCPECGASEWTGETDVMDTWMDSSISALHVDGWPETEFEPVQLREQGHDIIRTWAFYSVLRTAALVDDHPWDEALINGMVFGEDGHKMSKSRGNFVQPEEIVDEYGADAFRQAMALGGQPGSDVQFQWKEVRSAAKFLTKVWNIARFASDHVDESTPDTEAPAYRDADAWILARLAAVADSVGDHADAYRFDAALRELREFVWHDLADDYIELVKGRLYDGRPGERDAARHALYTALSGAVRMLAPFAPFVAEELYDHLPGVAGSVHVADWPAPDAPAAEDAAAGAAVAGIARAVRRWKSEEGVPLNEAVDRVEVYLDDDLALDTYDLSEAVSGPIYVDSGLPAVEAVPVAVTVDHTVVGPEFRDRAGAVVSALESADPAEVQAELDRDGEVEVEVNGEVLVVEGEAVTVETEYRAEGGEGEAVEVLETESATVLVFP